MVGVLILSALCATGALAPGLPDQTSPETYPDPLAPFNEKMFWFNLKVDKYVLRPVATGYADVLPEDARRHIGNFWDNVGVIPRFANNLFQLKMAYAGEADFSSTAHWAASVSSMLPIRGSGARSMIRSVA